MATERFLKLSQDKKDRILQAARHEFARVPFEDASINQIIREAGISRGSFYTYFEDKLDLLHYVFRDEGMRNEQYFRELLLRKQGNYWEALHEWVYSIAKLIDRGSIQEDINIIMQSGMMQRILAFTESEQMDHAECMKNEWFRKQIDPGCFRHYDRPRQFEAIIRLGNAIAMMTVMSLIGHAEEDHERVFRDFETEIAILREGADPHFRVEEAPTGDVSAGA
ncbi:MAG: TetR/AcrR family transcriptional regulator [Oribacterium sp.]|nr:TetR/AcrR family transcriptional regulator [Oribacterium sp.]